MSKPARTDSRNEPENRRDPQTLRARLLVPTLSVVDLDASREWYVDVVGFHLVEEFSSHRPARGLRLAAGDVKLILREKDGKGEVPAARPGGVVLNLHTVQDVDDLARRIEERGGTIESGPEDHPGGIRSFCVRDPDGVAWVIGKMGGPGAGSRS